MSLKLKDLIVLGRRVAKKRGGGNEGNLHYVIENKWRKNVRFLAFHYVIENTRDMVAFPLY